MFDRDDPDPREPSALPRAAQRVLAEYRAQYRMSELAVARGARRLGGASAPIDRAASRRRRVVIAVMAAALTLAVLGAWEFARASSMPHRSTPEQAGDVLAPAAAVATEPDVTPRTQPATLPTIPPRTATPANGGAPMPSAATAQSQVGNINRSTESGLRPREPAPRPALSSLRAERELLASARAALAKGALARVLERVEQHRLRFPDGLLAPEFAALAAVARCRQTPADAPHEFAAFTIAQPGSPLLATVRDACTAPARK